jgi:hypothetical protein
VGKDVEKTTQKNKNINVNLIWQKRNKKLFVLQ